MVAANRELIRAINQFNILNAIRTMGTVSRVEIAEITGQSRASVTNITAKLIQEGLIYEQKTEDTSLRGRKRVLLALNPDAAFAVGVKLSSSRISCAVTNMQADIISSISMPVRVGKRPVKFVADLIEEGVRHCVDDAKLKLSEISGIGLGIPGFVNSSKGVCYWTPLYRKGDATLHDLVFQRLKINTYIENDANCVTMAHQWFGEGRGRDNFLVITIEDGLGMGIVMNGQLYRGARGIAAEFGHVVVEPNGIRCRCGKKGCIEAYVSDFSILNAAKEAMDEGIWHFAGNTDLTIYDVTRAAQDGEQCLMDVFSRAGSMLGLGLSGLIQIFNPSRIIISGDGVRAGSLMFDTMNRTFRMYANPDLYDSTEIIIHKWKDTDWARGAASLVLQEVYKHPFSNLKNVL
ncbi:MAG: ROK family transcriptional regulator [Desulfobacteraceae bacterium]|nr:ROK family transcriptional regulator [Desulfobacteraceae bacterium]